MTTPNIDISNFVYCGVCYRYYKNMGCLRGHLGENHTTEFTCLICNERVPTNIRDHMRVMHKYSPNRLQFCACCFDLFDKHRRRDRHEASDKDRRPDNGAVATSPYNSRFLLQDNTIRRQEFGEHYAMEISREICISAAIVARRTVKKGAIETLNAILTMHLEMTNQDLEAVDRKRSELFNKVMNRWSPTSQRRILSHVSQGQRSEQTRASPNGTIKWENNLPFNYQQYTNKREEIRKAEEERTFHRNPTMSPNSVPMDPIPPQANNNPAMDAVEQVEQVENQDPITPPAPDNPANDGMEPSQYQEAPPQQQMGSGMEQDFDVPMNQMMPPNSGQMDPTQFQANNPSMDAIQNQQYLEQNQDQFRHHPPMNPVYYEMDQPHHPRQLQMVPMMVVPMIPANDGMSHPYHRDQFQRLAPMMNGNYGQMDPTQFQANNPVMYAMPNQQYLAQNQGQFRHHPPMNPVYYGMEQNHHPHQLRMDPTMNPNTMRSQAGQYQEALPQQRTGPGIQPDLDANPHFFSPNRGNWGQQPDFPDQFQQVDPRQEMQIYSGFDGSGPSTSSQQIFGPSHTHQYDGQD